MNNVGMIPPKAGFSGWRFVSIRPHAVKLHAVMSVMMKRSPLTSAQASLRMPRETV